MKITITNQFNGVAMLSVNGQFKASMDPQEELTLNIVHDCQLSFAPKMAQAALPAPISTAAHISSTTLPNRAKSYQKAPSPVRQLDIRTHAVIKHYPSISQAARETQISRYDILNMLGGKLSDAGGFLWEYEHKKNLPMVTSKPKPSRNRGARIGRKTPILQIDIKTNQLIQTWNSQTEAAQQLGLHHTTINKALCGNAMTAGGFKWQYAQTVK